MSVLPKLQLDSHLRARIHSFSPFLESPGESPSKFVLYLPTVCLRHEQNPAFAIACHAANHFHVPLIVLAVTVDDAFHASPQWPHRCPPPTNNESIACKHGTENGDKSLDAPAVVTTARRLTFLLQALSHASRRWSDHGAAVAIRIHSRGAGTRAPDHLTLASRASFVVCDEPFVSPYLTYVRKVEAACRKARVECVRVDGSCTVPPVQVLTRRRDPSGALLYDGVPAKAYLWQNKTEHLRRGHLEAAMAGHFDAPALIVPMTDEQLFAPNHELAAWLPSRWRSANDDDDDARLPSAPDVRPFTSHELSSMPLQHSQQSSTESAPLSNSHDSKLLSTSIPEFVSIYPGVDVTVPHCPQTIGTTRHGMQRWNNFIQRGGLQNYAKQRNDATKVHSVSRLSCYLNMGIVSPFRIVWEVKQRVTKRHPPSKSNNYQTRFSSGADKFEEEIVKWREMSYAHAFSRLDYDHCSTLPHWSLDSIYRSFGTNNKTIDYNLTQFTEGTTGNEKWDAMQRYLVRTGELHNNVRMTWGKTVVEWGGASVTSNHCHKTANTKLGDNVQNNNTADNILRTLCYLNDRYALDGLSPPSYAGLLWCMGWCDKPTTQRSRGSVNRVSNGSLNGSPVNWLISSKLAHRYRMTSDEFRAAELLLLESDKTTDDNAGNHGIKINKLRQMLVVDSIRKRPSATRGSMKMSGADNTTQTSGEAHANAIDLTEATMAQCTDPTVANDAPVSAANELTSNNRNKMQSSSKSKKRSSTLDDFCTKKTRWQKDHAYVVG